MLLGDAREVGCWCKDPGRRELVFFGIGRGIRRVFSHTGAIADSSVSSNTFSMEDFEGSIGGGLTSVGWSAMAAEVNVRPFTRG